LADIGNIVNFFVTWFDASDGYVTTSDITEDVLSISFTDTGSGQVNECVLKLSGAFGNFITDANKTTPTVIDEYDRFRVQCEDLAGNSYDRYFEFNPVIIPSQTKTEGTMLELNLIGTEYHTQRVTFSGRFWFSDAFTVARAIGDSYNKNREILQPLLSQHTLGYNQVTGVGNAFPKFTVNHYEYGMVEDSGYNRWNQMLDKLGGSVAAGGILDYFEVGFETSGVNAIEVALFSSGGRSVDLDDDANIPTITQSLEVNIGSTDVGIAAGTATQVAAWGGQTHGSLPTGHSIYASGPDQFIFRPQWKINIPYQTDSKVKYQKQHYNSKVDNNNSNTPPGPTVGVHDEDAFWSQIDMKIFGDNVQYSPWTDDKVKEWANCGAAAGQVNQVSETITPDTSGGKNGATMFDCNIVVLDNTSEARYFRTWVDFRLNVADNKDILLFADRYAYSGNPVLFPVGRRVLIDGFVGGDFAGNDSNGVPFQDNIAEWSGSEWIVKYNPSTLGADLENMQAVVIDESTIYQWDTSGDPGIWSTVTGDLAVDCLHQYTSISSASSYDTKPSETDTAKYPQVTEDGNPFSTNILSSIKSTYTVSENFDTRILGGSDTPVGDYFKKGSWLVWRIPFSPSNYGSPSVQVGNIYGTDTPTQGLENLQPSFLDTQNMSHTRRGKVGFNQLTSEDLGQLQEIVTNITIENKTIAGTNLDGPITVRCWMIDRYDNTVFFDIEIPFVDNSYPVKIPFSSFKIYRGRKPRFFDLNANNIATLILPQELEIINRFAFREIQMIGWQIQNFYDEFGRYAPDAIGDAINGDINNISLSKFLGGTLSLTIDDFHFTKPLLAIARQPGNDRNLEAEFRKRPHIITYEQLLNDAQTELEKEQFQLKEYQIETAGGELFALKFGDVYFFENDKLVNDEDDTTAPGVKKIKLVIKHIQYNLTSPGTGEGGFSRSITSVKRFE
jgi:hypothetical protein